MTSASDVEATPDRGIERDSDAQPARAAVARLGIREATLALFTIGLALRLFQYAANRSLWLDEAWRAPLVTQRSWLEVLDPATSGPFPPGFLVLSKLAITLLGDSEYGLRFVPFVAGVGALFVFAALSKRVLSPVAAVLAVGLFALLPFLIYYASEFKQNSVDVLATTALLYAALSESPDRERTSWPRALRFGLLWPLTLAFSYTASFILGGILLWHLARAYRARDTSALRAYGAVGVLWTVGALALYLLVVRGVATNPYAKAFWRTGFMPLPPTSAEDLLWFPHALLRAFRDPLGLIGDAPSQRAFYVPAAGMLAFFLGVGWLWGAPRGLLLLLTAPIALTLLASGLERYPFGGDLSSAGRVILFLVPSFILIMAAGLDGLRRERSRPARVLGYALMGILLGAPMAQAAVLIPYGRSELKPVLRYMRQQWRPGDVAYIHYDAKPSFLYYAARNGFQPSDYLMGQCARFQPERYIEQVNQLRGRPRVWLIFEPGVGAWAFDEKRFILDYADAVGRRLDARFAIGASAYLYDLRPKPGALGSYQARVPKLTPALEEGCGLWN